MDFFIKAFQVKNKLKDSPRVMRILCVRVFRRYFVRGMVLFYFLFINVSSASTYI